MKEPLDLLMEAIDQVIRSGSTEERIGGIGIYCTLIYDKKVKPNPEYYPLFLDLLVKDDGSSHLFTLVLVNALHYYPTRETVLAFVDAAGRSTNFELRHTALASSRQHDGHEHWGL